MRAPLGTRLARGGIYPARASSICAWPRTGVAGGGPLDSVAALESSGTGCDFNPDRNQLGPDSCEPQIADP
jgi:hypothetical protein